jgi:hypothetical protein
VATGGGAARIVRRDAGRAVRRRRQVVDREPVDRGQVVGLDLGLPRIPEVPAEDRGDQLVDLADRRGDLGPGELVVDPLRARPVQRRLGPCPEQRRPARARQQQREQAGLAAIVAEVEPAARLRVIDVPVLGPRVELVEVRDVAGEVVCAQPSTTTSPA